MMKSVGKLFGLRRKCAPPKSRIDKKKTRVNPVDEMLEDSDEGSYGSTTSVSSGSEYQNSEEQSGSSDSSYRARESDGDDSSDTDEKRAASRKPRKRPACAPVALDDSSSDSSESSSDVGGEPLRRALQRKRLRLPEDSEDEALRKKEREAEVKEAAAKRKERKNKLMELSKRRKSGNPRRRRRTLGSEEEEEEKEEIKKDKVEEQSKADNTRDESSVEENGGPLDSSEEEKLADSSDSLKDFIVEEDEQKNDKEQEEEGKAKDKDFLAHLPRQFITGSQLTHFQVVVKALLINVLDSTFLSSLYSGERTKRYAQEMKSSLLHFDERLVLPRLENLKQRSRWKERYKERVECYPKLRVITTRIQTKGCEACELHRTGRFTVRLSGQLYHNNSLQEDQFMPDDAQSFFVGSVCASRTEVYHALKHFKYHLFEKCRTALEAQKEIQEGETGEDDEPVKETVNKVFTRLQDGGWISEQYEKFQEHLNSADFFQEEKLD
ncbi:coiled-coil domain-containing protein 82 isoform X1 [Rhinichthys klamathensis goyatoka]|uniref:coiled-coil domain-containing protein 82 isoform X1 n=1 Tax=Rhinichthys klamathensis goyatoka TaxID=3034132 RepID=UPI0024B5EC92|nr:coiled-coil domain-containing protein 82 isoform X1 [Rhinichthys klamathensis goyatoka]XP_056118102.1 coiled-coil domain-containing protein 82 isoform X1 [Rhinichthys klamathensis goyatoka]